MALYEIRDGGLVPRPAADFVSLSMAERGDLQRLLRNQVDALGDDVLVIAEEFGDWEDARRRIDLLAVDRAGHLVVIELKRTETGGHMDLQAVRYAAMVSSMDFSDVVRVYSNHLERHRPDEDVDARAKLEEFLDATDSEDGSVISTYVRILLVAQDFGREITTTVLWLNGFEGMDVRCIRLVPYEIEGRVLLDIQQVLPLPEAADYQVQIRRKDAARDRAGGGDGRDHTKFHVVVDGETLPAENKRNAIRVMVQQLVSRGAPLPAVRDTIWKRMKVLDGRFETGEEVRRALVAAYPGINPIRWFTDFPLVDEGTDETYVLSNQWGTHTEERLAALAAAFPETKVTFRRADPPGA